MFTAARRATAALGKSATLVVNFLAGQQQPDGGFRGRAAASDLYYTVFALEALRALEANLPRESVARYLAGFPDPGSLDLVHATCLVRAWASIGIERMPTPLRRPLASRILAHRAADGGFASQPQQARGTVYAAFLALGACQDLGVPLHAPERIAAGIERLRTADGGFANDAATPLGITPVAAAALAVRHALGRPPDARAADWLMARRHPSGGFLAHPAAPLPDLLSTATALHALALAGADLAPLREPCLDYLDRLWSSRGGFRGNEEDDVLDCEYCWYGLLALGHLADAP